MDLILVIAVAWLIAASFTDIRKREVSDWLSFSLIAIAIAYSSFQSVIQGSFLPLIKSVSGLAIFFVIANILYYGRIFAGGDAKLLIALGAILPGLPFISNILVAGSIYGLAYSVCLAAMYGKEFISSLKKVNWKIQSAILSLLIVMMIISIVYGSVMVMWLAIAAIVVQLIQIFVRAVESSCLIRKVSPSNLTEGDWLFKDVKVGQRVIKADFRGLDKREIAILKKSGKKVYVKYGIPFIPVFLIAFIATAIWGNFLELIIKALLLG